MNADNLVYILETLAGYDAKDVDDNGDDFDVLFETECGRDTGATCSIVDIAQKSADGINKLINENEQLKTYLRGMIVTYKEEKGVASLAETSKWEHFRISNADCYLTNLENKSK
jgi:hypothetical protein